MSFHEFLRTAPYVRLLPPFLLGILSCRWCNFCPFIFFGIILLLTTLVIIHFIPSFQTFHNRWIWGVVLFGVLWCAGNLITVLHQKRTYLPVSKIFVKGRVLDYPTLKNGKFHVVFEIEGLYEHYSWKATSHKVVCHLQPKKQFVLNLNQQLLLLGVWKEIKNYGNPAEFDYKQYMQRMGVYYTGSFDSCHWLGLGESDSWNLNLWSLKFRELIVDYFRKLNLNNQSFGVITALTVGDKTYLDDEVNQAFVNSGTIHILAVSGLHIALLFWLLEQLTKPLLLWKKGKILRSFLVLTVIWIYALITGLSPSVVRASVMFTFWMVGESGRKQVNIYNTLSLSALVLLVIQPDNIYDVGFQLSYLAVLGIVVFYQDIYKTLYVKTKVLKYVWSILAVSLAAQLLTLPVTVFNFHQFPNYFLLANLIAIPLSTIILYGSILALVLSPFSYLWKPLGWILGLLINWMDQVLEWIEHLPGALTSPVLFTGISVFLMFAMVILLQIYILRRKPVYLSAILILALVGGLEHLYLKYQRYHTSGIIVYQAPSRLLVQFWERGENVILTDGDPFRMKKIVKPFNDRLGLGNPDVIPWDENRLAREGGLQVYKGFLSFRGMRLFVWTQKPAITKWPVKVNILLIHHLSAKDVRLVKKMFDPQEIILTSGVFPMYQEELKSEFVMKNIRISMLNLDGARIWTELKKMMNEFII